MKPGQFVKYTGSTVPALVGRVGIVERTTRTGWVLVTFQGALGETACAACNLTIIP